MAVRGPQAGGVVLLSEMGIEGGWMERAGREG